MGKYFGTDGIRGRASVQFPPLFVFKLGIAAAHVLSKEVADRRPLILIGKDTRISGDFLESALAAGMAAGGCDIMLLGVIPTPGVAALTRLLQADAAAVISLLRIILIMTMALSFSLLMAISCRMNWKSRLSS